MIEQTKLSNNALAVMALASEYCRALELAGNMEPHVFVDKMTHLLPRIYMAVTDLPRTDADEPEYMFGANHLDETAYDRVRQQIASLLGEDDTYLDTFVEDMKYSDTPICATVSEGLADIFQVLYNFVEDVRNADVESTFNHLGMLRADFCEYWSQVLCNVMRPLNDIARRNDAERSDLDGDRDYNDSDELDFV